MVAYAGSAAFSDIVDAPVERLFDFLDDQSNLSSHMSKSVRRQIIWRSLGLGLAEYRPRLWVDVMRRACGAASADAGWFVV